MPSNKAETSYDEKLYTNREQEIWNMVTNGGEEKMCAKEEGPRKSSCKS